MEDRNIGEREGDAEGERRRFIIAYPLVLESRGSPKTGI